MNEHPDIYDLGLLWGGVDGITLHGICPGQFTLMDGFWNQRYIGRTWDWNLVLSIMHGKETKGIIGKI
jgi:hypothetical protein